MASHCWSCPHETTPRPVRETTVLQMARVAGAGFLSFSVFLFSVFLRSGEVFPTFPQNVETRTVVTDHFDVSCTRGYEIRDTPV